jgi:hypothetical protein
MQIHIARFVSHALQDIQSIHNMIQGMLLNFKLLGESFHSSKERVRGRAGFRARKRSTQPLFQLFQLFLDRGHAGANQN